MFNKIALLILISMMPVFEIRLSIPLGITLFKTSGWTVTLVCALCILANIAVSPLVYFFLDGLIRLLCRIDLFNRMYTAYCSRVIERIRPKIARHGIWGLALFIGIPLPGSGVYSGAVGAHALGMGFKKYFAASVIGVLIAAAVLCAVVFLGIESLQFFIHHSA